MEGYSAEELVVAAQADFIKLLQQHEEYERSAELAEQRIGPEAQGFLTSKGRFVNREIALMLAARADQIKAHKEGNPNELYSEDVW